MTKQQQRLLVEYLLAAALAVFASTVEPSAQCRSAGLPALAISGAFDHPINSTNNCEKP